MELNNKRINIETLVTGEVNIVIVKESCDEYLEKLSKIFERIEKLCNDKKKFLKYIVEMNLVYGANEELKNKYKELSKERGEVIKIRNATCKENYLFEICEEVNKSIDNISDNFLLEFYNQTDNICTMSKEIDRVLNEVMELNDKILKVL